MIRAALQIRSVRPTPLLALDDSLPPTQISNFLTVMDRVLPWSAMCDLVSPHFVREMMLRIDDGPETLLRLYFLQQWYGLDDREVADAVADSLAMARFVGFQDNSCHSGLAEAVQEFRMILERNDLAGKLERLSDACLAGNGYVLVKGSRKVPGLHAVRAGSSKLKVLDSFFSSIEPPYGLSDIFRFNSIYRELYPNLNTAERQQAEQYVDMLLERVEQPTYAAKIYGVV